MPLLASPSHAGFHKLSALFANNFASSYSICPASDNMNLETLIEAAKFVEHRDGCTQSSFSYQDAQTQSSFIHQDDRTQSSFPHHDGRALPTFSHEGGRAQSNFPHQDGRTQSSLSHQDRALLPSVAAEVQQQNRAPAPEDPTLPSPAPTVIPVIPMVPVMPVLPRSSPLDKRSYQTSVWVKSASEVHFNKDHRDEDLHDPRRRTGDGTREVHNKLEKNRRAHLKECIDMLKKQLPPSADGKKSSNLNILHNALKYIQALKRTDREYEHEMEKLARDKIALQQKLANLKKELSARWEHLDLNTLVPGSTTSEHEEVVMSDAEEATQRRSAGYSSTSSLSPAANASSPNLPSSSSSLLSPLLSGHMNVSTLSSPGSPHISTSTISSPTSAMASHSISYTLGEDVKPLPRIRSSSNDIPDGSKMISFSSRLEPAKRNFTQSTSDNGAEVGNVSTTHFQLPVLTNSSTGQIAATLVSPTIQLVSSSNLRMLPGLSNLPGEQTLALSLSHAPHNATSGIYIMQKSSTDDESHRAIHSSGLRNKGSLLTIPNGSFNGKGGVIYKPSQPTAGRGQQQRTHVAGSVSSAHMVAPLAGVPVTVVSHGSQVTHIVTASSGKMVTPVSIKPLIPQYLVKPGAAMVVVSQSSSVSKTSSK